LLAAVARLPEPAQRALFVPWVRRIGIRVPVLRAVYLGCFRRHPIDLLYGTDTSGIVDAGQLQRDADASLVSQLNPYMGSQPSIVRRALQALGDTSGYTFMDIGCGKGRAMIVASEFAFEAILGYDISAELVRIANQNALTIARRFPERPTMHAVEANVSDLVLMGRRLVVFLYNPFDTALVATMLRNIESGLASGAIEHVFIVYDNPVSGHVFDASTALTRWFAGTLDYEPSELGYGPQTQDAVVIWQSVRCARPSQFSDRGRPIVARDRMSAVVACVDYSTVLPG
jgi:SAM-dependent methyltransferase